MPYIKIYCKENIHNEEYVFDTTAYGSEIIPFTITTAKEFDYITRTWPHIPAREAVNIGYRFSNLCDRQSLLGIVEACGIHLEPFPDHDEIEDSRL
jgi:hypothetical protein